jgi:hypothetical protein
VVLDWVRPAEPRNAANPGGPSRGSARGERRAVRHAYSRTAVSKPLEQMPPSTVKRYGLLAREEAGLK